MGALVAMTHAYLADWLGHDEGQGMVEYVLIIGTISLVIVFAFLTTGITSSIAGLTSSIASDIDAHP